MTQGLTNKNAKKPKRAPLPPLCASLALFLAACGDSQVVTVDESDESVASNTAPRAPFVITPSRSAGELADVLTLTVQSAVSEATGDPDLGAATPDISVDADLVDPLSAQKLLAEANPEPDAVELQFDSVTTQGFQAEVLEDSIRLRWNPDPNARGYNIYKQGDFYRTVLDTNEFIDTEVFDDDYYYEIQAFDNNDNLYYIATGLTVSARSFGRSDPQAPQVNNNRLDGYELVFSDEFTGSALDTDKWNTSFLWGTDVIINNEEQHYVDVANEPDFGFNPFTFDGENLRITTIPTPPDLAEKAGNQPFLSGIITSYDSYKFTYGFAEMRAQFTHGQGYWPAFWLLNAYYGDADPEIDIMEFIGHNQDVMYHTYHYFDNFEGEGAIPELRSTESFPIPGQDYTADFHTFAVEWAPDLLVFYVNGIETYRIVDVNVSDQPMYVLANQAVGGWWAGPPDETTPFPGEFIIDYIRVFERPTPADPIFFDQPDHVIPLNTENREDVIPNKRPSIEQWSNGFPAQP